MRRIVILLILVFTSSLPALATAKPEPVQLRYTVDARQAAKRLLKIQAQIEGLPEGRTTIIFPDSKTSVPNRISQVGRQSEDGEVSSLTLEDGRLVVESSGAEPVKLVFQLRGERFQHLERATYLDEYRCLFHPQDVLLQIENHDPKVTVSFVLPDQWEVVSSSRPALDGTFPIETRRTAPPRPSRRDTSRDRRTGSRRTSPTRR